MEAIENLIFADWFRSKHGFVGIRPEYNGTAVYEYRSETDVKHYWYQQKVVAYALFEELRLYLEV